MNAPGALPAGAPYPCPSCGSTEHWRVDYDQAVSQGCVVVADGAGGFNVVDHCGDEETYDDGSSTDEALRCRNCDYEHRFEYVLRIPVGGATPGGSLLVRAKALAGSCFYSDESEGVDELIAYKNALEDELFAVAGRVDGLVWALRDHVARAEAALRAQVDPSAGATLGGYKSETTAALEGSLDAWRIALGYWDSPPAPPRAAVADDLYRAPADVNLYTYHAERPDCPGTFPGDDVLDACPGCGNPNVPSVGSLLAAADFFEKIGADQSALDRINDLVSLPSQADAGTLGLIIGIVREVRGAVNPDPPEYLAEVYLAINSGVDDGTYVFSDSDERDRFLFNQSGHGSLAAVREDPFCEWYATDEPVIALASDLLPHLRGSAPASAGRFPVPNEGGPVDTEAKSTSGQQGDSPVPEGDQPTPQREVERESTTHASEKVREPAGDSEATDGSDDS